MSETLTLTESSPLLPKPAIPPYTYISLSALTTSSVELLIHLVLTRHSLPTATTFLLRGTIPTTLCLLTLTTLRPPTPHSRQLPLLLLRSLLASSSLFCHYQALRRLPLGTNATILAIAPGLTSVFCATLLRERLSNVEIGSLALSFLGVFLVAHASHPAQHLHGSILIGTVYAALSALFTSGSTTLVRVLGTHVHPLHNVLALNLGVFVWAVFLARAEDYSSLTEDSIGVGLMVVATVLGFLAATLLMTGLQRCRAGPALLLGSVTIPLSYVLGLVFLGETCSMLGVCGALLVVAAVVAVGVEGMRGKGLVNDV